MLKDVNELPAGVYEALPPDGREIYLDAYNVAYENYDVQNGVNSEEERVAAAHKAAWDTVRELYIQHSATGTWRHKHTPSEADMD